MGRSPPCGRDWPEQPVLSTEVLGRGLLWTSFAYWFPVLHRSGLSQQLSLWQSPHLMVPHLSRLERRERLCLHSFPVGVCKQPLLLYQPPELPLSQISSLL